MDRNTPGLDPATRQQLIDLDQDKRIAVLESRSDLSDLAVRVKRLEAAEDALNQRLKKLENKPQPLIKKSQLENLI